MGFYESAPISTISAIAGLMHQERILAIHDISCVGRCSLTVALPIISSVGIECSGLPTAVLSTHTGGFTGFTYRDLTEDMMPIDRHWQSLGIKFDAFYTGFLGSFEQIDLMHTLFDDFGKEALKIVDPCMADNGKLYPGFTPEFALSMAKLCSKADVLVPNLTETAFMLDIPYPGRDYCKSDIENLLKQLADLGAKKIVLKGIEFDKPQPGLSGTEGKIGIASYDAATESVGWYFHKKMPVNFHGTGDIFASVLTGALMRGLPLEKAYALAGDFVAESIAETLKNENHNWYGVDFEAVFPYLLKRLAENG